MINALLSGRMESGIMLVSRSVTTRDTGSITLTTGTKHSSVRQKLFKQVSKSQTMEVLMYSSIKLKKFPRSGQFAQKLVQAEILLQALSLIRRIQLLKKEISDKNWPK